MIEKPASVHRSYWGLVRHEFLKRRLSVAALALTIVLILIAIFAPYIANDVPIILSKQGNVYFPSTVSYAQFRTTDWGGYVANLPVG